MANKLFQILAYFLFLLASVHASERENTQPKLSLPQSSKQISAELLNCSTSTPLKRALCTVVERKLNSTLHAARIQIDRQGLLFSYDDPTTQRVDTGHSCSVTADITRKQATARFSSDADLDFEYGAILSEPLVVSLRVPVHLEAKVDLKQKFGVRVFGRCRRVGSDRFTMEASLSTMANVVIGLTLNPDLRTRSSGDFVVSVKPVAAVIFDLENTELDFEVRGLSFVTALAGPLLGFTSSLTDGIKDLFDGRGVNTVINNLEDSLLFDLGVPILSRVDNLPRPARDLVFELLSDVGQREVEKEAEGYGSEFEQLLNSKIRSAIGADSSGEREFVIRRDILDVIDFASIDDLLL